MVHHKRMQKKGTPVPSSILGLEKEEGGGGGKELGKRK